MPKVLFCATVDYHFKAFHIPYLQWFKEQGWEVHVAAAGNMELPFVDMKYDLPIQRSPFSLLNYKAFRQLKEIMDTNEYELIHCHTPMGGVLTRMAARKARRKGTKVLYTAHGFHFCKGAPLLNWLVYYPIERFLAKYTDCLITINEEDYQLAKKHQFKSKRIEHVHGVGVNTERYKPMDKENKHQLRKSFGYKPDDFLMFYAAEFNQNKNQQLLIRALALIKSQVPQARLLLAGDGPLLEQCRGLALELGVDHMVNFLGFRKNIELLLPMCDMAVASSLREGLPVNVMEAMSCGLPIVATENRGHSELIQNHKNGYIVNPANITEMAEKLRMLAQNKELKLTYGLTSLLIIKEKYDIQNVLNEKRSIYTSLMEEMEEYEWAIQ